MLSYGEEAGRLIENNSKIHRFWEEGKKVEE